MMIVRLRVDPRRDGPPPSAGCGGGHRVCIHLAEGNTDAAWIRTPPPRSPDSLRLVVLYHRISNRLRNRDA